MADFSCYVVIDNKSSVDIQIRSEFIKWGRWEPEPESAIRAGSAMYCRLEDKAGPGGSEGQVEYQFADGGTILFYFECPFRLDNEVKVTNESARIVDVYAKSEVAYKSLEDWSGHKGTKGNIPYKGHPLSVLFVVQDA